MTSSKPSTITKPGPGDAENSEVILKVEGVSKKFSYSLKDVLKYGTRRLFREFLGLPSRTDRLEPGEFWALDDVSFELQRGEALGIIGLNGAGKSTLLKVVNGIFLPDRGLVAIKGTVAGLIEIGAGFQPNLTGRENIHIIASILGMTKEQVDRVFDNIVEFADIGRFIDSPVQNYSSGMIVRLGFAIHVFQKPDVLFADEILAVGDFEFQQKCLAKINEIRKDIGMILVSHSMPLIARFCNRAIVLDNGKKVYDGTAQDAIAHFGATERYRYLPSHKSHGQSSLGREGRSTSGVSFRRQQVVLPSGRKVSMSLFGYETSDTDAISDVKWRWQNTTEDGLPSSEALEMYSDLTLSFSFRLLRAVSNLVIGIPIFGVDGTMLTGFSTDNMASKIPTNEEGCIDGVLTVRRLSLNPGEYIPFLSVSDGLYCLHRQVLQPLRILAPQSSQEGTLLFWGIFSDQSEWRFNWQR